jgi:adenosylhomocysteine nucleosidase
MSILVVAALKDELKGYFDDVNVLYTGVGKVNAAHAVTKAILKEDPDLILNFGSAGSKVLVKGTIVNCLRFIQRDMDCLGLDVPIGITPYDSIPGMIGPFLEDHSVQTKVTCYTGDKFLNYFQISEFENGVVDMEAYAIAKVCLINSVPFACFKIVTDGMNSQSKEDWQNHLSEGAKQFRKIYDDLLIEFSGQWRPDDC